MAAIRVRGTRGGMACSIDQAAAFPGAHFVASIPETIGDWAGPYWYGTIRADWETDASGGLRASGVQAGELEYSVAVTSTEDTVDFRIRLTNTGKAPWRESLAFNCFSVGGAAEVRDHDCLRHWVGVKGRPVALRSQARRFGPRPAIQLYPVEGRPAWRDIPFLRGFDCSPDGVALEPWMAIADLDGRRLAAVASRPGLFLFQNREYSCIHSAPGFGPLAPGETGHSVTRVYLVRQSLRAWYARMTREMAALRVEE